ncbi:2,3-diaminopropionate biosynthesis protein SbnA [Sorangium sp. So ce321]|uniref:2,3-diaminopropionate biosynthesis protein SbnA n=1 Tax=Sorangium sp. So ce321 TaxID=3133300 RepID=UPI003F643DB0
MLSTIGRTPLISLRRLSPPGVALHAKLEFLNPGGSAKDRPALAMLEAGIAAGEVHPDTVVIESSSGNMGIGLAQACAYLGLEFICVIDVHTTTQTARTMRAYGAALVVVEEAAPHGDLLEARLSRVRDLVAATPRAWWPNQYVNAANARAHRAQTAPELVAALGRAPDYVICPVSTCGMLAGMVSYFREVGASTRIIAVDLHGSAIFGSAPARRLIPGLGSARRSSQIDPSLVDEVLHVSNTDCVVGCRLLAKHEAILAGGSSGGTLVAALRLSRTPPADTTCALLLPDRGERYLDTIFDDAWVARHIGPLDEIQARMQELRCPVTSAS